MTNFVVFVVSMTVSVLLCELCLRAFTPFPIHDPMSNRVAHEALGYVLAPWFPEADSQGFRNPSGAATEKVEIVTIGDSHTYGFNVSGDSSWPGQLSSLTGASVYNFGMGGYGILQYQYTFLEAVKKKPRTILMGLFLMNDLANYCEVATLAYWEQTLESAGLENTACKSRNHQPTGAAAPNALRDRIKSTAIGSLLAFIRQRYFYWTFGDGTAFSLASQDTWTSLNLLRSIIRQTDTKRAAIEQGRKAALYYLARMAESARANGIAFGVLLIPSRERVLFQFVETDPTLPPEWRQAVMAETELVDEFSEFFLESGIRSVDALDDVRAALRSAIHTKRPIYPVADDHPLETGYQAYALAALRLLP